jgi:pSer/pThr/pTyr-binding forkhead associated (FHA) protein
LTVALLPLSHRFCVICRTCRSDNPSHLTHCRECGQRLGSRGVPATPIAAVTSSRNASPQPTDADAQSAEPPQPPSFVPQRPPAPPVNFARAAEADEGAGVTATVSGQEATSCCPLCGNRNASTLRFCGTCGQLLGRPNAATNPGATAPASNRGGAEAGRPVSTDPPRTMRPPAPEGTAHAITPGRVVDLGAPATGEAMLRLCPRCRGGSDPTSPFCRFCGASLAEAPSISLAPRTPVPPDHGARGASGALSVRASSSPPRSTVAIVSPVAAAPARAHLVLIARDGTAGPGYPLGEATDVGRAEGNIIVSDDGYMSPRHARILLRAGGYYLRDLGSTNGIYLRIPFARAGESRPPLRRDGPGAAPAGAEQAIVDQDLFLVGQQVLKFEVVKHAEEGFGVASENGTLLFGTPAAPRYARLSQRTIEGVVRDMYYLQKLETVIGREIGDLVFTEDPFLSRRHAAIVVHGVMPGSKDPSRRFSLMDLGSSNGTFLQLREEIRLKNGDHLRIGQQLFRFDLDRADA